MAIRFNEDDVRSMGRAAAGVRGMKMRAGDEVVSLDTCRDDVAILIVTDAGYGKRTQLEHFNRQGRGGQGVRGIKLTAKKGFVVAAFMVGLDDEIFVIASGGVVIRMPVRDISSQGRDATGVRVMNLDAGQTVACATPVERAAALYRRRRRRPWPGRPRARRQPREVAGRQRRHAGVVAGERARRLGGGHSRRRPGRRQGAPRSVTVGASGGSGPPYTAPMSSDQPGGRCAIRARRVTPGSHAHVPGRGRAGRRIHRRPGPSRDAHTAIGRRRLSR